MYTLYRELQLILIPTKPQKNIIIDFITNLPKSIDKVIEYKYNAILNIVDRIIKGAQFIPF